VERAACLRPARAVPADDRGRRYRRVPLADCLLSGCGTLKDIDLTKIDRHPDASIMSLIPESRKK